MKQNPAYEYDYVLVNNAEITRDGLFVRVKNGTTTTMSLDDFQSVNGKILEVDGGLRI